MWLELKRISALSDTGIGESINKDSRIKGFDIEGMKIFIKDDEIRVECNGKVHDFSRRPSEVMERIIEIGRDVLS